MQSAGEYYEAHTGRARGDQVEACEKSLDAMPSAWASAMAYGYAR